MAKGKDHIDLLCEEWARGRRALLGIRRPLTAREYVGSLRCTLGARRDLHAGSRSEGRVEQHWPEVFSPDGWVVNRIVYRMRPELRQIMDVHFVVQEPRNKSVRADYVGLSKDRYWQLVGSAKTFIEGALSGAENVATISR